MDLKSGYPYWAVKNGLMQAFPRLEADAACEVAVIGGGITGALIACELAAHGIDVVVVEQRDIGWGSTAASTAMLQYEIDTHLGDLAKRYGEADAALAYRACAQAIDALDGLARALGDVDFARCDSLYYASRPWHRGTLEDECALRARHGLPVEWLPREALQAGYGIDAPGAILSRTGARVDPYRFAHRLLERLSRQGVRIFDRSTVEAMEAGTRGVRLRTGDGATLRAGHVVLAAGYANQHWLARKVARNASSYAYVTDPLPDGALGPWAHTLLWESARPYLYLRGTGDGRLVVGGEDDAHDIPARRDRRVPAKVKRLRKRIAKLLPHLDAEPAFSWAGTFAETEDGLPFFGATPQWGPRVLFAMAYGGNGITYSAIGARLLRMGLQGRRHPLAGLFGFARLDR